MSETSGATQAVAGCAINTSRIECMHFELSMWRAPQQALRRALCMLRRTSRVVGVAEAAAGFATGDATELLRTGMRPADVFSVEKRLGEFPL